MAKTKIKIDEHGDVKKQVDSVSPGAMDKDTTFIEPTERKTTKALVTDVYKHMNVVHERLDTLEDLIKLCFKKQIAAADAIEALQLISEGKNPEFERNLKKAEEAPPELTDSQTEIYGPIAPSAVLEIVHQVLGVDFGGYMKPDSMIPRTLFTVLVPERLTGLRFDFRSVTVDNISTAQDVKKWCEKVKSNIHKHFSAKNVGNPNFMIAK